MTTPLTEIELKEIENHVQAHLDGKPHGGIGHTAPEDVPRLLTTIRALQGERDKFRLALEQVINTAHHNCSGKHIALAALNEPKDDKEDSPNG